MGKGPVIMIIGTECPPDYEDEFNRYYTEKHLPQMFQFHGVKKAARYKISEPDVPVAPSKGEERRSSAKYLAIYEWESWDAIKEYNASKLRQEVLDDWAKTAVPKGAKIISRNFYEPIKTWQK